VRDRFDHSTLADFTLPFSCAGRAFCPVTATFRDFWEAPDTVEHQQEGSGMIGCGGVVQLVRTPACHGRDSGFELHRSGQSRWVHGYPQSSTSQLRIQPVLVHVASKPSLHHCEPIAVIRNDSCKRCGSVRHREAESHGVLLPASSTTVSPVKPRTAIRVLTNASFSGGCIFWTRGHFNALFISPRHTMRSFHASSA
jgi:hypothetical protein